MSKKIVVIEDMEDSRTGLAMLLELEGHQVLTAEDGASGLELILGKHPDIALVDIGLPGIDGYEVARRVRARVEAKDVKLVALTGYGEPSEVAKARAAGFDAHLLKPLEPGKLRALLE
jgi:CheY-like chemotaxis protein